jgi:hypothetical protein
MLRSMMLVMIRQVIVPLQFSMRVWPSTASDTHPSAFFRKKGGPI